MTLRPLETTEISEVSSLVVPRALGDGTLVLFPHNWADTFSVVTTWETDVVTGLYSGIETKVALLTRPRREVTSSHLRGDDRVDFLRQWLNRLSPREDLPNVTGRYMTFGTGLYAQAALWSDATKIVTVPVTQNQALADFTGRRFFVGGRAAILRADGKPFTISGQDFLAIPVELTAASRTQLVFDPPPVTIEAGMIIVPVIDVYPAESVQMQMITGRVAGASVTVQEARGQSALPPHVSKGFIPPDFQTYTGRLDSGLPLLVVDHNWAVSTIEQHVRLQVDSPIPMAGSLKARRGVQVTGGLTVIDYYYVARLFDSMQGRAGTFWAVMPQVVATSAVRLSSSTMQITPKGNREEWLEQVYAVAFQRDNGEWQVLEIATVSSDWVITVFGIIQNEPITCLRWACYAEFGDQMTETWTTNGVVDVEFEVIEASVPVDQQLIDPFA